jgi:hypothetical protein
MGSYDYLSSFDNRVVSIFGDPWTKRYVDAYSLPLVRECSCLILGEEDNAAVESRLLPVTTTVVHDMANELFALFAFLA